MEILFIQILRLGDAIQLTPIIKGLKASYPEARISVLTSGLGKEVFANQPEIEQVFVLRKQKIAHFVRCAKTQDVLAALDVLQDDLLPVLSHNWDWVVNFSYSFPSALLAFLADGSRCSGFHATESRNYVCGEKWFSYAISAFVNRKYSIFNWVDINKGITSIPWIPESPVFSCSEEELNEARSYLAEIGFLGDKVIGIHPGASGDYKRWPVEKFVELAHRLVTKPDYKVLVFGDPGEKALGRCFTATLNADVMDLTGKTSLRQLAALISQCSLLICNDSGPMHLASALGTPIISLFFNSHYMETGPYGENFIAVHPDIPCFPCKQTSACQDKKCLEYVSPATIEEVALGLKDLTDGKHRALLSSEEECIAVNISRFDPWRNIEWVPANQRRITIDDVIRCLLKVNWVSLLTDYEDDKDSQIEYISGFLNHFFPAADKSAFIEELQEYVCKLKGLNNRLQQSQNLSMELMNQFLQKDVNLNAVRELGIRLQKTEEEISEMGFDPHLGLFTDFLDIQRRNLLEPDYTQLASKTARIYQDVVSVTAKMISLADVVCDKIKE